MGVYREEAGGVNLWTGLIWLKRGFLWPYIVSASVNTPVL
jgi:hypothetical protein